MNLRTKALDTKGMATQAQADPVSVEASSMPALTYHDKKAPLPKRSVPQLKGIPWLERNADIQQMSADQCQGNYEIFSHAEMVSILKKLSAARSSRSSRKPNRWETFFGACPAVIVFAIHPVSRWLPWKVRLAYVRIYLKTQRVSFMRKLKKDLKKHYLKERRLAARALKEKAKRHE